MQSYNVTAGKNNLKGFIKHNNKKKCTFICYDQELIKDLQTAKRQTWEERERLSEHYDEERRITLANKVILTYLTIFSELLAFNFLNTYLDLQVTEVWSRN